MSALILNPVLLLSPVENGYVAYDPTSERLQELNPLAALMAELCEGRRTVDEIRELVGPLLPEGRSGEIDRWIEDAAKSGVVTFGSGSSEGQRELSSDELAKLASRLEDHGKIRTAFLCQCRAVELAPDQPGKWYDLAELAYNLGRRSESRTASENYCELKPDDAEALVGVDISREMLALARAREIYDRLEVAEITEWLGRSTETFDLIVSCDCLIYFGDLRQVVIPAAKRLLAGGILAFTLERGDRYPFRLTDSGRYAHGAKHVSEVAAEAGLIVKSLDEGFLRKEYGADVTGLFVALSHSA